MTGFENGIAIAWKRGNTRRMKLLERHVRIVFFSLGLLWGVALTFTGGVLYLRASLIREIPSRLSYEETVEQFSRNAAVVPGWTVREQKCGLPAGKIAVFELCSRKYAAPLLVTDPQIGCMIPCRMAIFEKTDGTTCLAVLNTALFMRLIGGNPGEVFRRAIIPEQEKMLEGLAEK